MKWKVVLAVGAVAGGALWFVRRKSRRAAADAELWAEATDPIARFGESPTCQTQLTYSQLGSDKSGLVNMATSCEESSSIRSVTRSPARS